MTAEAKTAIRRLATLPAGLTVLRAEAAAEGFRFLDRLVADWQAGRLRFDRPGEMLAGAFHGDRLVAIAGLSIDPYADAPATARLRHLYVLLDARRQGIATQLVRHLLAAAGASFTRVRLRTDTREAARFYEALGFAPVRSPSASHALTLAGEFPCDEITNGLLFESRAPTECRDGKDHLGASQSRGGEHDD